MCFVPRKKWCIFCLPRFFLRSDGKINSQKNRFATFYEPRFFRFTNLRKLSRKKEKFKRNITSVFVRKRRIYVTSSVVVQKTLVRRKNNVLNIECVGACNVALLPDSWVTFFHLIYGFLSFFQLAYHKFHNNSLSIVWYTRL